MRQGLTMLPWLCQSSFCKWDWLGTQIACLCLQSTETQRYVPPSLGWPWICSSPLAFYFWMLRLQWHCICLPASIFLSDMFGFEAGCMLKYHSLFNNNILSVRSRLKWLRMCTSVLGHLHIIHKALGLILSTTKTVTKMFASSVLCMV